MGAQKGALFFIDAVLNIEKLPITLEELEKSGINE
jgi:hypothetical protein